MKGGAGPVDPVGPTPEKLAEASRKQIFAQGYGQDRERILDRLRLSGQTTEYHAIYGQSCKALKGYNETLATLLKGHIDSRKDTTHVVFLLGPSDEKNEMRGTLSNQDLEERTYIRFEDFPICLYGSNNIIICELCAERSVDEFFKTKTAAGTPSMMDHRGSVNTFENMIELMVCNAMFGECKASDIHHWAGCGSPQILRTAFNFFPITPPGGSQVDHVRSILNIVSTRSGFESTGDIDNEQIADILKSQGDRSDAAAAKVINKSPPQFLLEEEITGFMNEIFKQRPLCLASCVEMIQWMESWKDGWDDDKFSSFPIETEEYTRKRDMEVNNITKYLAGFNKGDIKQSWVTFQTLDDKTKFPQNDRDY